MPTAPTPSSYWLPGEMILAGEFPGWRSHDAAGVLRRLLDAGVRTFVDLTQTIDPLQSYETALEEAAAERGLAVTYRRFPVPDMDVPAPRTMASILAFIDDEVARGRKVYLHCLGGVGRTGTVAGCLLARELADGGEALRTLSRLFRSTDLAELYETVSPQTEAQRAFVRDWPGTARDLERDANGAGEAAGDG